MTLLDTRGSIYGLSGAAAVVASRAQMAPGFTYSDLVTPGALDARLNDYVNKKALTTIPNAVAPDRTLTDGTGWGNIGDSPIEGPGQFNFDTTVMKNTGVGGIHESALLQFRAEFFNLFNHPQFGNQGGVNPVPLFNNVANGNFGQIGATSVNPRLIQLALKYIF